MNWSKIWNAIVNFFTSNGWSILLFFAILFLGIIFVRIVISILKKIFEKSKMEKIAGQFIITIVKFLLYLILTLILLGVIGIEVTGVLTALSAMLLAVGMALQNNIANLANGIIVVSTNMFKKGDYIKIDGIGVEGCIDDINFLFTTLITTDNKKVTLPNSTIVNNAVINAGGRPKRRVDFTFSVAYESDVEKVKQIVKDVMKSNGKVDLEPEPFCRLKYFSASSIDFFANCWCDSEDYWEVYYYVMETLYNEFKKNNISIPYNQVEVRNRTDEVVMPYSDEPLQERIEKVRKAKRKNILADLHVSDLFKTKKTDKSTTIKPFAKKRKGKVTEAQKEEPKAADEKPVEDVKEPDKQPKETDKKEKDKKETDKVTK